MNMPFCEMETITSGYSASCEGENQATTGVSARLGGSTAPLRVCDLVGNSPVDDAGHPGGRASPDLVRLRSFGWLEGQADAVDAVPLVGGGGVALAVEAVAEVGVAPRTPNLDPLHAEAVVLNEPHGVG